MSNIPPSKPHTHASVVVSMPYWSAQYAIRWQLLELAVHTQPSCPHSVGQCDVPHMHWDCLLNCVPSVWVQAATVVHTPP